MRAKEVANILKTNKQTVVRWIRLGYLKGHKEKPKTGGGHDYWAVNKEDIDIYLNKLNQ